MNGRSGWLVSVALALCLAVSWTAAAGAESLQEKLQQFGTEVATGYMRPVADAIGADLNAGIVHSARTHGFLGFDVGLKLMAISVPDEAGTFVADVPPGVTWRDAGGSPVTEVTTATAVGTEDGGATIYPPVGDAFEYPGGVDLSYIPLAVPQASIGMPFKTDVMIRYLPKISTTEDVGDVGFIGLGLKHSVSQYIPAFPLDVAVYGMWQSLDVGDFLETSNLAYGIVASKSIPLLTVYGSFNLESASMDLTYDIEPGSAYYTGTASDHVELSFDSDASSRLTAGVRLSILPFIFVNGEVSKIMGSDNLSTGLGAGVGVSIR